MAEDLMSVTMKPAGTSAGGAPAEDLMSVTMKPAAAAKPAISPASAFVQNDNPMKAYPPAAKPEPAPAGDALGAFTGGVVEGVPIAGPLIEKGVAAARSATGGQNYATELAAQEERNRLQAEAHPIAHFAGELVGGVGSLLAGGATATGARLLGITGPNMLARTVAGGASGMALMAGDAALRGQDPIVGGLVGGAFGAGAPVAGEMIGAGANKLASVFRGSATRASEALGTAAAGKTPQEFAAEFAANPKLAPMDTDTNLLLHAQGIAAQPGPGRDILDRAVKARMAAAPGEVDSAFDTAMGPTPNVLTLVQGLKDRAAANAKVAFGAAFSNATPVDAFPTIAHIDEILSRDPGGVLAPELKDVRARLIQADGTATTDPQVLHEVQTDMRKAVTALNSSATKSDHLAAGRLAKVRNDLVGAIDDATGGQYRPAQKQYANDKAVEDAFSKGLTIFQNRAGQIGLEDRPEYWANWAKDATPDERQALKLGIRVAADHDLQAVSNAVRKGIAIPEVGFTRDKLAVTLGQNEADRLATAMKAQKTIANSNNKLFAGSKTAETEAAKEATFVPEVHPLFHRHGINALTEGLIGGGLAETISGGAYGHAPTIAAAALPGVIRLGTAGIRKAAQVAARNAAVSRNALSARALSEPGGAEFMNLLSRASDKAGQRAALSSRANRLAIAGTQAGGLEANRLGVANRLSSSR